MKTKLVLKVLTVIAGAALAYDGWALATGRTRFNWVDTVSLALFIVISLLAGREKPPVASQG